MSFVDELDLVSGNADAALDEGLLNIDRVPEDDDVPAFGLRVWQNELRHRPLRRVGQLIDQQVIADQQRVFHGTRGDDEGLYEIRRSEEQEDDGNRPLRNETALRFRRWRSGYFQWLFVGHDYVFLIHYPSF